jgi:hypothetical protein
MQYNLTTTSGLSQLDIVMSITILHIEVQQNDKCLARVRHEENELLVLVYGDAEFLSAKLGQELIVEMNYTRLLRWKECPEFSDEKSYIRQNHASQDAISVYGRVHNVMAVGEGEELIDLYIQNGPEFLSIAKSELGASAPAIGTGIEVTLEGLCFYPSNT